MRVSINLMTKVKVKYIGYVFLLIGITSHSFLVEGVHYELKNCLCCVDYKVRKRAKIRNRYNQASHLTQDTNGKVTTSQLDIKNESLGVSPIPAGDHKASTNRRA